MRIIQVVNVRWFNATAWYGLFLSRLLKDAGHEVLVLGLEGKESFKKAQEMGLNPVDMGINSANPMHAAGALARLDRLIRGFKPQVVNCHRGEGTVLWGLLKAAGRKFALVRTRGDQRSPKGNLPNKILHGRLADAVIATNSRTQHECITRLRLAPDMVYLVPGGVDTGIFRYSQEGRKEARERFGFAETDTIIGLLGRFDKVKGQEELIRTVSTLRSGSEAWRQSIRLMLAGFPTSTPQEEVEGWIRQYGMEPATVITGKYPDVAGLVSAMDVGVIASQGSEAIARAAFEIMSCGVPLAGTTVGVMPDLLPERALVEPKDEKRLAVLLERLVTDDTFREELREEEGVRMRQFSEKVFLEQTLRVYEDAMRRAGLRH